MQSQATKVENLLSVSQQTGMVGNKIVEIYHLSRNAIFELLDDLRADLEKVTKRSHTS